MIPFEVWALILGFSVPMIISPGPGNTILAAAGGHFGVRGSIPFLLGFEAGDLFWCLVYGFGLSQVFVAYPALRELLKWGGIIFTLYLAYGFFQFSSLKEKKDLPRLNAWDGFLSVSLNPKIHSMILVLFSQFLNPSLVLFNQVMQISMVFVLISMLCHLLWIYSGQLLFSQLKSQQAMRVQGYLFGGCLIFVAIFMGFV
ncbi:LysE family translocator [Iodobacter sp.]|uniref:LysE family translocator n=1 Tax=Iodobacter sp. TaxID=1915058 RepID=UPI0025D38EE7|nr:LysE family translocator [Iodobacter sp.]